jgi:hypothetical protein
MLHRLAALLIIIFWICMTGLLVVKETVLTQLNNVPAGFVAQLIFQHQQSSDLQIYDGPKDSGYLHVQPSRKSDTGAKIIDFHGNLGVNIPGGGRQRLSWMGNVDMDENFQIQKLRVNVAFQQGGGQVDVVVEPPKKIARYSVKTANSPIEQNQLSLDENGLSGLLSHVGLGPVSLPQLKAAGAQMSPPEFITQTSSLQLNGETVSTYLFIMKVEGQTIIEAHLSQLGQVLRAQIPLLGYKFAPQNVNP